MEVKSRADIKGRTFVALLNRIRVRVLDVEETSEAGIILNTNSQKNREQMGCDIGIVLDIGPDSFDEYKDKSVKVGDVVLFSQYGGKVVPNTDNKERIINDVDLIGRAV